MLLGYSQELTGSGKGGLPPLSPAMVSAPVLDGHTAPAAVRPGLAYVSMPPGTDPTGVSAAVM
jgi:hypothetical protein